ncbi:plancitoxin-1-like [Dermacentor andersoni]|uniref:plancitoxin-1-like n=1 Tax=Dermacentor andersoni TaxID=34620 RepID=UPI0021550876|nr:plancitoxin-1-like [Dermacentor andersoni]
MTALSLTCLSLTLASLVTLSDAATSCKNEKNADVDWFFMYKLPRGAQGKDKVSVPSGEEYLYIDSRTPTSTPYWMLSTHNIFNESNSLANTIAPLTATEKPQNLAYAVYNDQPPYHLEEKKSSNGHTKGLFIFDGESGVWIIHSVPKFPEMLHKGQYSFPPSGREYGQTILCVTFPTSQLETIAMHLRLQYPNIYDSFAPESLRKGRPALNLLLARKFIREAPWVLTATLKDVSNNPYVSFAKHGRYNRDVYSAAVASNLETNLFASTWRNGAGGKVPADCNDTYTVTNVDALRFKMSKQQLDIRNGEDHSKWAISEETSRRYVCIGTLNRMHSQYRRGGQTLCFKNALLHKLLLRSVTEFDNCSISK